MTNKIIIIGGGIIGSAIARFLSAYALDVLVLEKGTDITSGATKANSGILHAGYDCRPGTLKAAANVEGLSMYKKLVKELDIPHRMNGSMVIGLGNDNESHNRLNELYENGVKNGVSGLEILSKEETLNLEPNLSNNVTSALRAKTAGVISPYEAAIAFAENAAVNGVKFMMETTVTGISYNNEFTVYTSKGNFIADVVVNAAGVESACINNMINPKMEEILPQRGQYYLLDNTQKSLVHHTIFQQPTHMGKGVLIAPTVDYNILLGPTAEDINDASNTETTISGLAEALEKAKLSLKNIPIKERITNFAGVRAKHKSKDFIIEEPIKGFVNTIGIDSPGLTAAPSIAKRVVDIILARLQPNENKNFNPIRLSIKKFKELSIKEQAEIIIKNPAYGKIVCRCETITEAEIIEAINRPLGSANLGAIKRRTRAQMGRCQGGFCTLRLMEICGLFNTH